MASVFAGSCAQNRTFQPPEGAGPEHPPRLPSHPCPPKTLDCHFPRRQTRSRLALSSKALAGRIIGYLSRKLGFARPRSDYKLREPRTPTPAEIRHFDRLCIMLRTNPLQPPRPFSPAPVAGEPAHALPAATDAFVSAEDFDQTGILAGVDPCESRYWWLPELYGPEAADVPQAEPASAARQSPTAQATSRSADRTTAAA
jgi:hypothetical protein